jgi:hypothetical protein
MVNIVKHMFWGVLFVLDIHRSIFRYKFQIEVGKKINELSTR